MKKFNELVKSAYIGLVVSYYGKSISEKIFVGVLGCAAYTLVTLGFIIVISTIVLLF